MYLASTAVAPVGTGRLATRTITSRRSLGTPSDTARRRSPRHRSPTASARRRVSPITSSVVPHASPAGATRVTPDPLERPPSRRVTVGGGTPAHSQAGAGTAHTLPRTTPPPILVVNRARVAGSPHTRIKTPPPPRGTDMALSD